LLFVVDKADIGLKRFVRSCDKHARSNHFVCVENNDLISSEFAE